VPNSSPQAGHFIRSKSIRSISAGVMTFPHFGQMVSRDACNLFEIDLFPADHADILRAL
jgi:hypothetical protein